MRQVLLGWVEGGPDHDTAADGRYLRQGKSPPPVDAATSPASSTCAAIAASGDQISGLRNKRRDTCVPSFGAGRA